MEVINLLENFNLASVIFRLFISMMIGGLIGLERGRKHRGAGFKTYMLVCMGATLTVLLSQYEYYMLANPWHEIAQNLGVKTDVSRLGAQVINGIGFLGAGTIMVTGHHKVKGLTTAAGLWASACMGLAVGAGFYICVLWACLMILFCMHILPYIELKIIELARNMTIYIEMKSPGSIDQVLTCMTQMNADVSDIEIDQQKLGSMQIFYAVLTLRLAKATSHAALLTALSQLDDVITINEM